MIIEGVLYEINWRKFKKKASFFIPCNDPVAARMLLRTTTDRLKFTVVSKVVVEEGIKGLRMWRV